MVRDNTNTQITTLNNSRYNYSREAEVIHGNAATGEQYSLKRNIYSEVPITPEMVKRHWDEMDKEIEKLEAQYPGQVVSAISYQEIGGNQVIKFTPTTELIFPGGVPIFDEKGNQIIGKDNIRAEIERRKEEWKKWEREGKLQEHVEIHHTDDGKTVRIKFRAAPKRLHPNEMKAERDLWEGSDSKRFRSQIEDDQKTSEGKEPVAGGNSVNTSGKNNENMSDDKMDTDNNETSSPEVSSQEPPKAEENSSLRDNSGENSRVISEISENRNQWEVRELSCRSGDGSKQWRDFFLVHKSAKVNSSEIGSLIFPVKNFSNDEREIVGQLLSDNHVFNYQSKGLSDNYNLVAETAAANNNKNKDDKDNGVGKILAVVGVVGALIFGGAVVAKKKLFRKGKKK